MEFEGEDGEVVERFGPTWMAPEQEQALEDFVLAGGAFMPIHNSSTRPQGPLLAQGRAHLVPTAFTRRAPLLPAQCGRIRSAPTPPTTRRHSWRS